MYKVCFIFHLLKILGTENTKCKTVLNSFIFFHTKFHFVTFGAVISRQLLQQISYAGRLNHFTKAQVMSSHCTASYFVKETLTNMTAAVKVRCCITPTPHYSWSSYCLWLPLIQTRLGHTGWGKEDCAVQKQEKAFIGFRVHPLL